MLHLQKIHHVAIIVSNYEQSKYFYTKVLGLKTTNETYRAERRSYKLDLRTDNHDQIELFSFPDAPPRPSYPEALGLRHLAFAVDDVDQAKVILEQQDITVENIRIDAITGKRFTFFADPDGLPIELYEL